MDARAVLSKRSILGKHITVLAPVHERGGDVGGALSVMVGERAHEELGVYKGCVHFFGGEFLMDVWSFCYGPGS